MTDALFAIALVIAGTRLDLPPAELDRRFEAECVDGRWAPDCPAMRTQLEVALYADLRELGTARAAVDRETLRAAAAANFPPLAELALRRLERIQSPEDRDVVLAAVEHPAPAVREVARRQLEAAEPEWKAKQGRWWHSSHRQGFEALVPDAPPDLAAMGLGALKAVRFRAFASGDERSVFTTKMTPDQVIAAIGQGRKVFTGAQLGDAPKQQKALEQSMADVQKRVQAAMARGDMKAVQEIMTSVAQQQQETMKSAEVFAIRPVKEFTADPASIRYLQVPADKRGRTTTVAVARDDGFGETVVVVSPY
ncbi:MAG: hypothetical protein JNK67_18235 [Alphaproteobacteria bacterium]|nr:hypothetical protein [Alphaproteobacteria bacterium]